MLQKLTNYFTANPNKLFLADGCGALLSTFLLGVVLVQLQSLIGMPTAVLFYLAAGAAVFTIYSFSCYFSKVKNWRPFLRAIAITNILYCCLTLGLVFYFYEQLTALGIFYFIVEIILVVSLSIFELKVAGQSNVEMSGIK